jgi:ethanolamine utilization microcompartment shell protein EutS
MVADIESLETWIEPMPQEMKIVARLPAIGPVQAVCLAYLQVEPQADDVIVIFGADLPAEAQVIHRYANGNLAEISADIALDATKYRVLGRYANITDSARQSQ